MIQIPEQLKEQKFILTNGKIPVEKGWTEDKNYYIDDPKFQQWIKENNTYGIYCSYNNLIYLDCDEKFAEEQCLKFKPFQELMRSIFFCTSLLISSVVI